MEVKSDLERLIRNIEKKLSPNLSMVEEIEMLYSLARTFQEFCGLVFPDNNFADLICRNIMSDISLSLYFAHTELIAEGYVFLRRVLDLVILFVYGSNHVLEVNRLMEGRMPPFIDMRKDVMRLASSEAKNTFQQIYGKLSIAIHGLNIPLLERVRDISTQWGGFEADINIWKNWFRQILMACFLLIRCWFQDAYNAIEISKREEFEKIFIN